MASEYINDVTFDANVVYGPRRLYFKIHGHYVKLYIRGKDLNFAVGISGVSDFGFYATIDADRKKLPRHLIERPDVVYYRRYHDSVNNKVKEHLIFGPFESQRQAVKYSLKYDDNKHLKIKIRPDTPPWMWGVIRITPLSHESDLDLFVNKDTIAGRIIAKFRKI